MKIEPQILRHGLDQAVFGVASIKLLVALAIVIALLSLWGAIVEARRRPSTAVGWLAGAAIVAAIVASVLVWHTTAVIA
ncbi:hypothetical protein ACVI1J_009663 [Bradyrhizobium diazoefficiens]|uniref:hypothetical protein n=1 Tax=Bradyrhizobium diazoefficiens TaxID=1355477 RepID=UPI0015B40B28|nr:hypothetical protein [Bradyrhizobium diazoefficiens]QLD43825.1 hypothetical protein HUW42_23865 [Bradyrhizobium diazoefficiens]